MILARPPAPGNLLCPIRIPPGTDWSMSDSSSFAGGTAAPDAPRNFVPVAMTRTRRDGWTPDRQHAFIAALARTAVVAKAARAVGMSAKSAYALHKRAKPGSSFARAWDDAVWEGRDRALDRAITAMHGVVHVRRSLPGGQWIEQRIETRAGEGLPAASRTGTR